jgi:uncharacterized membrane protein
VVIERPRPDVFAFVANHENGPKWRRGVVDIKHESGSGRGAVYRQTMKGPFGRRIPADIEITDYEENSRVAFHAIAGPVRPEGRYIFDDVPGGTRVTFSLNVDLHGPKKLMAPMVSRVTQNEVGQLDELKRVLESGGTQPGGPSSWS